MTAILASASPIASAQSDYTLELTPHNKVLLLADGVPATEEGEHLLQKRLSGSSSSECKSYGRRSQADAAADIAELNRDAQGISIKVSTRSSAFGGHYRTCLACVSGNCIGIHGNDTEAQASAESNAIVTIRFNEDMRETPYLLDVASSSIGQAPQISLTDASGKEVDKPQGSTIHEFIARPGAVYYLRAKLATQASNSGMCCSESANSTSRIDIKLRKAPLLSTWSSFVPFIVGGKETQSYKNVGAILIDGRLHCTGTVISSRSVLTAAHCIAGYESQFDKFTFLVGSNLVQPSFGPVKLAGYSYPNQGPDYRFNPTTLEDDVALVYLDAPVSIKPVKLHAGSPDWTSIRDDRTSLVFVGYGYDVIEDQKVGVGIKREAAWSIDVVENRRVSFSVFGKSTCKGDSGGPAFLIASGSITQVAITSGGTNDCSRGFETRVDAMSPWIQANLK